MSQKPRRRKVETTFGENLRALMKARNLSHRQVSEMAGVSVSTTHDWCGKGGSVPHDLTAVGRLAQRLGVRFDVLVLGYRTDSTTQTIEDFYDEMPIEQFDGVFKISGVTRLIPKKPRTPT